MLRTFVDVNGFPKGRAGTNYAIEASPKKGHRNMVYPNVRMDRAGQSSPALGHISTSMNVLREGPRTLAVGQPPKTCIIDDCPY